MWFFFKPSTGCLEYIMWLDDDMRSSQYLFLTLITGSPSCSHAGLSDPTNSWGVSLGACDCIAHHQLPCSSFNDSLSRQSDPGIQGFWPVQHLSHRCRRLFLMFPALSIVLPHKPNCSARVVSDSRSVWNAKWSLSEIWGLFLVVREYLNET